MNSADPSHSTMWHTARQLCATFALSAALILIAGCSGSSAGSGPASVSGNTLVPTSASTLSPAAAPEASGLSTPQTLSPASSGQPTVQTTPNAGTLGPPATVSVSFTVPSAVTQSLVHRQSLQRSLQGESHDASRALQYISASNVSLKTVVTPTGGGSTTYTGACTTVTCTVSFTATAGPTTLAFSLTDGAAGTGNTLSTYSTVVIVRPNGLNTFAFTANPVVDHVTLSLASTTITAGTAADVLLSVNAKDIDNNTIIGQGNYVNASGNPLSLLINVKNSQAGGKGSAVFHGPTYISAPSQAATYLHYNGGWLDHTDVTVTATKAIAGSLIGTTLMTIPHVTEYAAAGNPTGMTVGPDGNLWFTENSASAIGKITTNGVLTSYPCSCTAPHSVSIGADGNIWFTAYTSGRIGKMTTSGVVTLLTSVGGPVDLITGNDGNVWYSTDVTTIGKTSPSGVSAGYSVPIGPRGLVFGADGNLWYMAKSAASLVKLSTSGSVLATYPIVGAGGCCSERLVSGPDGNIWFANSTSNLVEKSDLNGNITSYSLTGSANPTAVTVGSDNAIWFTESGTSKIGRLTTTGGGNLLEWGNGSNGMSSGAFPYDITVGPDGNLWFVEIGLNKIGKFVY